MPRSCGVTTIRGRRSVCHKPASSRPRALPDTPDTTTSLSGLSVSAAIRRKSATSEIRATILGIRLSMTSISDQNSLDDPRRRLTLYQRDGHHPSAPAFDFAAPHDFIRSPIGTLHENIGADLHDSRQWR